MNHIIQNQFIPQQLLYFIAGRRCCQQFAPIFRATEREIFMKSAQAVGLRALCVCSDGQCCIKVYKRVCKHYLEEPKILVLHKSTIADMFALLDKTLTYVEGDESFLFSAGIDMSVPSLHMHLSPITPPPLRSQTKKQRDYLKSLAGFGSRDKILPSIYAFRVVVVNAELYWDNSVLLPILILEDCRKKKLNAKIFCIERDNILAIYNCERLASFYGEEVGETVGIQIPQYSNISTMSHIVYTTSKHYLRLLISQDAADKFQNVSHFVVNDVHLHDPHTDILANELRNALSTKSNMKVVLLSQNHDLQPYITFFGEGIQIKMEVMEKGVTRILYLEDIHSCISLAGLHKAPEIVYKDQLQLFRNNSDRNAQLDNCLQAYEQLGTDAAFRLFLYAVNYELVPVNYRHSVHGKTAILIATQLNNTGHVRLLLFLGADPYIVDEWNQSAVSFAAKSNSECNDVFNNYSLHGNAIRDAKPEFVDYDLIIDIIYLLLTRPEYLPGNILILLPTYYHMVKLNYMLLSHYLTGNLQTFAIFLLHSNMDKVHVDALVKSQADTIKIVLATDIIESMRLDILFTYSIDTACEVRTLYNSTTYSNENKYEWLAKDRLWRRKLMLNSDVTEKQCFRLISMQAYERLTETSEPPIKMAPLDKICLTVKLLSPNMMISEYLSYIIAPPQLLNVHHAVQFLKKIEVLDEAEDVTWLGCRLIDLPVPCQLGRTLIFGILLHCLDPILTIVSSLINTDPLGIPLNEDIDRLWDQFTIYIQNRIKGERIRLSDNQFSDHFVFVHLFHEWHCRLNNSLPPLYLTDEYEFIVNGLMEELNFTRSNIVTALRTAHLVHSHGQLSMQAANSNSASWPLVKAALTGGMYPNICVVDAQKNSLKSAYSMGLHLHPNSVLRDFLEPFSKCAQKFKTPWIVCTQQNNQIIYGSVVLPLTVAMFAGPTKLRRTQMSQDQTHLNNYNIHLFIDEWIWMAMSKSAVELLLKTRQCFFKTYHYFLKHCSNSDKWQRNTEIAHHPFIFQMLSKILETEEILAGLTKFSNIGYQPIVKMPSSYLLSINSHFNQSHEVENAISIERQFFLLYTESPKQFYRINNKAIVENALGKFVRPIESPKRHIFIILYGKKPDNVYSISRAITIKGELVLKEYFRNSIPVLEIMEACASLNVSLPTFDERLTVSLIDKRVGKLIMDLFAFRNHWIHKR
ncbi:benign gonial cell neoplasm protein isoform X1 [Scaptodrosophila lebanonensis]|uniref:Benign gonial cell neoplasm protein isoform X1 n=1 Tax=Drosophila lebanonensis TaxID=7225 RepID=A0A6J2TX34_DROLE|nr:benign gonial cell neoplasm protein isoform X1 [Scaptodrosophila lebanonensis]